MQSKLLPSEDVLWVNSVFENQPHKDLELLTNLGLSYPIESCWWLNWLESKVIELGWAEARVAPRIEPYVFASSRILKITNKLMESLIFLSRPREERWVWKLCSRLMLSRKSKIEQSFFPGKRKKAGERKLDACYFHVLKLGFQSSLVVINWLAL